MTLRVELDELARAAAAQILGDLDAGEAAASLVDAEACFFVAASAGLVLGLRLGDGSRVALKAVRPRAGLAEARRVQERLHAGGFPCPRPLAGPLPLGRGVAFVDEWRDGEPRDVHDPARRRAAAGPARGLPRALEADGLFPQPHHPRFDFSRRDGAWIDAAAARARPVLDAPAERVVGHSDWSAKHFGWEDGRLVVVWDWPDSLVLDAEETIVGQASLVFPSTWDIPVASYVASPEESEAFVGEYEDAAGRRLDGERLAAARTYLLAYCARCELSDLDGADGDFQRALRAGG